MESTQLVDCAGRWRSPATLPGYHRGRPPRNKGLRYPADPPTVEEIISVMRAAGDSPDGIRLRGVIVVLWRAGLRISEALALNESDLDSERGAVLVRHAEARVMPSRLFGGAGFACVEAGWGDKRFGIISVPNRGLPRSVGAMRTQGRKTCASGRCRKRSRLYVAGVFAPSHAIPRAAAIQAHRRVPATRPSGRLARAAVIMPSSQPPDPALSSENVLTISDNSALRAPRHNVARAAASARSRCRWPSSRRSRHG